MEQTIWSVQLLGFQFKLAIVYYTLMISWMWEMSSSIKLPSPKHPCCTLTWSHAQRSDLFSVPAWHWILITHHVSRALDSDKCEVICIIFGDISSNLYNISSLVIYIYNLAFIKLIVYIPGHRPATASIPPSPCTLGQTSIAVNMKSGMIMFIKCGILKLFC